MNAKITRCMLMFLAAAAWSSTTFAAGFNLIDVIPATANAEAGQQSEPTIAVNLANTQQMVVSSFSDGTASFGGNDQYFTSSNGGSAWEHSASHQYNFSDYDGGLVPDGR